jgi:hypothetical protein
MLIAISLPFSRSVYSVDDYCIWPTPGFPVDGDGGVYIDNIHDNGIVGVGEAPERAHSATGGATSTPERTLRPAMVGGAHGYCNEVAERRIARVGIARGRGTLFQLEGYCQGGGPFARGRSQK